MDGGLESRCVGLVCGADVAVHHPHRKHFILFHEEDARSNNPQGSVEELCVVIIDRDGICQDLPLKV